MYRIYRRLPIKNRIKLKADLLKLQENLKKQNEKLSELFLKANNNHIDAIKRVLNNDISLEQYLHISKKAQEYKVKVFKFFKIKELVV